MAQLQPYVSNIPLQVAKNLRFPDANGIPVTEMLPVGMNGTIPNDSPTTGYISRIGAILSNQIDLYNDVAVTLQEYGSEIADLIIRVDALELSGTTMPYVNGACFNGNTPILIQDAVQALIDASCLFYPVVGTPSDLTAAILAENPSVLNVAAAFSQLSAMAGLQGWISKPETIADTINNLWLSYLDARAGIARAIAAMTPTCAQVIVDYQPIYSAVAGGFSIYFSGYSFIPTGYVDGGSTISIDDGLGNILMTGLDVQLRSVTTDPLFLSISGSALNPSVASYTVTLVSNLVNSGIGTTCIKTTIKSTINSGGMNHATGTFAASISGSTASLPLVTGLTFNPSIVTPVPANAFSAQQMQSHAWYMVYDTGSATMNFVDPLSDTGDISIKWIAYI